MQTHTHIFRSTVNEGDTHWYPIGIPNPIIPILNIPIIWSQICGFIPIIHHDFLGVFSVKGGMVYLSWQAQLCLLFFMGHTWVHDIVLITNYLSKTLPNVAIKRGNQKSSPWEALTKKNQWENASPPVTGPNDAKRFSQAACCSEPVQLAECAVPAMVPLRQACCGHLASIQRSSPQWVAWLWDAVDACFFFFFLNLCVYSIWCIWVFCMFCFLFVCFSFFSSFLPFSLLSFFLSYHCTPLDWNPMEWEQPMYRIKWKPRYMWGK